MTAPQTNTTAFATHVSPTPRKFRMDANDTVVVDGVTLTRVIANVDIPGVVKAGEKGGYIENFWNLSYNGTSWVHDGAFVMGETAQVSNDAQVRAGVTVVGCTISADADISEPARVTENQPALDRVLAYMARKDNAAATARPRVA